MDPSETRNKLLIIGFDDIPWYLSDALNHPKIKVNNTQNVSRYYIYLSFFHNIYDY